MFDFFINNILDSDHLGEGIQMSSGADALLVSASSAFYPFGFMKNNYAICNSKANSQSSYQPNLPLFQPYLHTLYLAQF